jgi:hypothetical protein
MQQLTALLKWFKIACKAEWVIRWMVGSDTESVPVYVSTYVSMNADG